MTFLSMELSRFFGRPVELYEFKRGVETWVYTSARGNQTFGGVEYGAAVISRKGSLERNQVAEKTTLTIRAESSLAFLGQYITSPPSEIVTVTIRRMHTNDPDLEAVVIWLGRVTGVKFLENEAEIYCESFFTTIKRPGLRRYFQTNCPHVLYGNSCCVNRDDFALITSVASVSGISIVSEDFALQEDNYYTGGFIVFMNQQGNPDRRFIINHVGNTIDLSLQLLQLLPGSVITVYPGCNHTLSVCHEKFNNVENYGGFPYIPEDNPMAGESVF